MAIFKIFYFRPEHRDTFRWGSEKTQVSFTNLTETHALVREFEDTDPSQPLTLDDVFAQCQGEVWSPNGEARGLIRGLGLDHTSMSVGDIIVEIICSEASLYMVEPTGFKLLGSAEYRIAVEKQEAKSRKANDHMYAVEVQKPGQYETRTTIDIEAYNCNSAASKARKLGWEVRSVNMIG